MGAHFDPARWAHLDRVVVLSPHLDDAALSCGALLAALPSGVDRVALTICAGDATAGGGASVRKGFTEPAIRRAEDRAALATIDCHPIHLGFADAIDRYRNSGAPIYNKMEFLGDIDPDDREHSAAVQSLIGRLCCHLGVTAVLAPLSIGRHVDHWIAAQAGLALDGIVEALWLYEDVPYMLPDNQVGSGQDDSASAMKRLGVTALDSLEVPVHIEDKTALVGHYASQVGALFGDEDGVRTTLRRITDSDGQPCERLWRVASTATER